MFIFLVFVNCFGLVLVDGSCFKFVFDVLVFVNCFGWILVLDFCLDLVEEFNFFLIFFVVFKRELLFVIRYYNCFLKFSVFILFKI